jgi:hypothetical protein
MSVAGISSTGAITGTTADLKNYISLNSNNYIFNIGKAMDVGQWGMWINMVDGDTGAIQGERQGNSYKNICINPYGALVGIGTLTPQYRLDVNGSLRAGAITGSSLEIVDNVPTFRVGNNGNCNITSTIQGSDAQSAFLNLSGPGGVTGPQCGFNLNPFYGRAGGPACRIYAQDNNYSADFYLQTAPQTNGATAVTRIFISSATGFVGINTTNPQYQLQVNGSLNADAITGNSITLPGGVFANSTNFAFGTGTVTGITAFTNGYSVNNGTTARVVIDNNANITGSSLFVGTASGNTITGGSLVISSGTSLSGITNAGAITGTSLSVGTASGRTITAGNLVISSGASLSGITNAGAITGTSLTVGTTSGNTITGGSLVISSGASLSGITNAGAITGTSLAIRGSGTITTPASDNNSTTIATTAYVKNQGYSKVSVANATYNLSGGGTVTWNGTTRVVSWSQRVIAINLNDSLASSGFFYIDPTSFTFPRNTWSALYYVPTNGMGPDFDNTKLIRVGAVADIGENWIFICSFHADNLSLRWNPGYVIIPNGGIYDATKGILQNPSLQKLSISNTLDVTGSLTAGAITGTSLAISGSGTITTPATSDNSTAIATTAYVKAQNYVDTSTAQNISGIKTHYDDINRMIGNGVHVGKVKFGTEIEPNQKGMYFSYGFYNNEDDVGGRGLIQADFRGNSFRPICINPNGGTVGINQVVPDTNYSLDVNGPLKAINITGNSLNVTGQNDTTSFSYIDQSYGNQFHTTAGSNVPIGIFANNLIRSGRGFFVSSDQRIKKNIQTLSPEESLHLIQNLKPVSFDYIDPTKRITKKYGFIAQEVESVLPTVINHSSEYIPNIFELVQIDKTNKTRIRLTNKTTDIFELSKDKTQKIKLKFYDASNNEILREIQEIIDDKTMILSKPITEDPLFLYGQEVPDFRSVEHEQINAVLLSAVQAQQTKIESLESKNVSLETKNVSLEKKIQDIESKIDFLLSKIT